MGVCHNGVDYVVKLQFCYINNYASNQLAKISAIVYGFR